MAGLIFDADGNLYGTTYSGGSIIWHCLPTQSAEVRRATTGRSLSLRLYRGSADGGQPAAALVFDELGNLYSTTTKAVARAPDATGCGDGV